MSKKIEFDYEENHYTLEYNREAVKILESKGFRLENFDDKLMTNVPLLLQGAFIMHHPTITIGTIEKIYQNIPNKKDFSAQLYGMVADTYNTLFEEVDEKDAKKIEWKVV